MTHEAVNSDSYEGGGEIDREITTGFASLSLPAGLPLVRSLFSAE